MSKNEKANAEKAKLQQFRVAMAKQSDGHIVANQLIDFMIQKSVDRIYNSYVSSKLPSYMSNYGLQQAHEMFILAIMPQDANEPIGPHRSAIEDDIPVNLAPDNLMVGYQKILTQSSNTIVYFYQNNWLFGDAEGPVYRPPTNEALDSTLTGPLRTPIRRPHSQKGRDNFSTVQSRDSISFDAFVPDLSAIRKAKRKEKLEDSMIDFSTTIIDLSVREKTFDEEVEEIFADKLRSEYFDQQKKLKQKAAEEDSVMKVELQKRRKVQLLEKNAKYRPFTFGFDGKPLFLKKTVKPKEKLIPNNTSFNISTDTSRVQPEVKELVLQDVKVTKWRSKDKSVLESIRRKELEKQVDQELAQRRYYEKAKEFLGFYGIKINCDPKEFKWTDDLLKLVEDSRQNNIVRHIALNPGVCVKEKLGGRLKVRANKEKMVYYNAENNTKQLSAEEYEILKKSQLGKDPEQEFMDKLLEDDFGEVIKQQLDRVKKQNREGEDLEEEDDAESDRPVLRSVLEYKFNGLPEKYRQSSSPNQRPGKPSNHNITFGDGFIDKVKTAEKKKHIPIEKSSSREMKNKTQEEKVDFTFKPLKPPKILPKENLMTKYIGGENNQSLKKSRKFTSGRAASVKTSNQMSNPPITKELPSLNTSSLEKSHNNNNQSFLSSEVSHIMSFAPNLPEAHTIKEGSRTNAIKVFKQNILDELRESNPPFLLGESKRQIYVPDYTEISSRQQLPDIGEISKANLMV